MLKWEGQSDLLEVKIKLMTIKLFIIRGFKDYSNNWDMQ